MAFLLSQKEIKQLVEMNQSPDEKDVFDAKKTTNNKGLIWGFKVKRNINKKWEITFSTTRKTECGLKLKGGEIREFSRLNGVEKFMGLIGVKEFTVDMRW